MDNETEFKHWFLARAFVKTPHVVNIDLSDAPGVPDTNWCCEGREGWIEFKWLSAKVRAKQYRWFEDRAKVSGRAHLAWGCLARPDYVTLGLIRGEDVHKIDGKLNLKRAQTLSILTGSIAKDSQRVTNRWLWECITDELMEKQ